MRYPPKVVTAQIHKHYMLGFFLGVGQKILFKGQVLFVGLSSGPGTGDRPGNQSLILTAQKHLRRSSDYLGGAEIKVIHVSRRIQHP